MKRFTRRIAYLGGIVGGTAMLAIIAVTARSGWRPGGCIHLPENRRATLRDELRTVTEIEIEIGSESYQAQRGDEVFDRVVEAINIALKARCGRPAVAEGLQLVLFSGGKTDVVWAESRQVVIDGVGFPAPGELVERAFSYVLVQKTLWYPSGRRRAVGQWELYKRSGHWKFFRESGELWREGDYKDGKEVGRWIEYGPNGSLERPGTTQPDDGAPHQRRGP